MNNAEVAAALTEIAELLELSDAGGFRIRAYENAAKAIDSLPEDINQVVAAGQLKDIKGVGQSIAEKIVELIDTGHVGYLEQLRTEFPPGVVALMSVPGVGPSLARRVYRELGISDLDELKAAAEDGRLATLKGMGEKAAENVLLGLQRVNKRETRISIGTARPVVDDLIEQLSRHDFIANLTAAGSLRRWRPTIGDIDLIATSSEPERAMEVFVTLPAVKEVLAHGVTKSTIVTFNRLQVDLRIVEAEAFGSLLQHFTGSRDHNIQLREYALRRGQSLNEYGVTSVASGELRSFVDEAGFYEALGLGWIPPELREGRGEIEAELEHRLPTLVEVDAIKGDLHVHSDWSDGSASIRAMALAARDLGYEYIAMTDHSAGIGVAGGLSVERVREQMALIRELNDEIAGITILTGSEVDIKRDGSLDFPDDVLADLDWVIASVHSGFNQSEEVMTQRIVRAIENPHVDAVAHPTGGLIGKRPPYAVNLEAVFEAASRTGTALEINAQPSRLDLTDLHARRAKDLGVMLVVNTDAHAATQYDNIRYGVEMARRGWAEAANVLNTRSGRELQALLRRA